MIDLQSNFANFVFDAHYIIEYGGLILILAIIYIETGFFLGFVLPGGDYLLFATGMFSGTHYLDIPLELLLLLLVNAAFLGDFTGFFKGKWLGEKLFVDNKSRFFKKEYIEKGSRFYKRFGTWAFVLGRFMPVIQTLVPMLAGASDLKFKKFLLFNLLGAVTWVCTLVPLGYYIGKTYPGVMKYSIYILLIFVIIASIPMFKIMFSKIRKA
ncbi:MAG: DedA family protein [Saprospiraceae bacterium]|nr:DedA family protein [Saprospiraceae bacterium]